MHPEAKSTLWLASDDSAGRGDFIALPKGNRRRQGSPGARSSFHVEIRKTDLRGLAATRDVHVDNPRIPAHGKIGGGRIDTVPDGSHRRLMLAHAHAQHLETQRNRCIIDRLASLIDQRERETSWSVNLKWPRLYPQRARQSIFALDERIRICRRAGGWGSNRRGCGTTCSNHEHQTRDDDKSYPRHTC
jgi:hypothetical protein